MASQLREVENIVMAWCNWVNPGRLLPRSGQLVRLRSVHVTWLGQHKLLTLTGCLALIPSGANPHLAAAGGNGGTEWLTSIPGDAIGALGVACAVVIAWRQRVIQRRDHEAERQEEDARRQEFEAKQAKIAAREAWRPEYTDIRNLLERTQKLYFSARDHGPYTITELRQLGVETICLDCETLAKRGIEQLRHPLLQLKDAVELLVQNAVLSENSLTRADLRIAALQERAARDMDEQITSAWDVLREEWGS